MSRRLLLILAALTMGAQPMLPQQSAGPETDQKHQPQWLGPWRHFGPQAGGLPQPVKVSLPPEAQPVGATTPADIPPQPPAVSEADLPTETISTPAPEPSVAPTVSGLSADYERREQDRNTRRQELEAAAHNDPTLEAVSDIQATRLLLEGEQDRMQTSEQLSQAFSGLATKLQAHADQLKALLEARRETAQQSDAEVARLTAEAPDLNLALKNLVMLPASSENDEFMRRLADRLNQADRALEIGQERSRQAHVQIKALEADEQELVRQSREARTKAASFAQTSQDAKVNEGLLADRLEFSEARKRASDELSNTSQVLETSVPIRGNTAVQQAILGGDQPPTPRKTSQQVDALRDCIRRTGDVAACRANGGAQP
jgi:hypothetical protein